MPERLPAITTLSMRPPTLGSAPPGTSGRCVPTRTMFFAASVPAAWSVTTPMSCLRPNRSAQEP